MKGVLEGVVGIPVKSRSKLSLTGKAPKEAQDIPEFFWNFVFEHLYFFVIDGIPSLKRSIIKLSYKSFS